MEQIREAGSSSRQGRPKVSQGSPLPSVTEPALLLRMGLIFSITGLAKYEYLWVESLGLKTEPSGIVITGLMQVLKRYRMNI